MELALLYLGAIIIGVVVGLRRRSRTVETTVDGSGWLCFIGSSTSDINVGITAGTTTERLRKLQEGSPERIRILYKMPVQDASRIGQQMMEALSTAHIRDGWHDREAALHVMADLQEQRGTNVKSIKRAS